METGVLFVDDDERVLRSLQRLVAKRFPGWHVAFANHADAAIALLRTRPFDILVSDFQMPDVDGGVLARMVQSEYPATVRIMLSGETNNRVASMLPAVHQFLSKPCDIASLGRVLQRSRAAIDRLANPQLRAVVGGCGMLPTPSPTYLELARLAEARDTTLDQLAAIVTRDPALASKALQLVNSAFFAIPIHTSSIATAVGFLGVEMLQHLALAQVLARTATGGSFDRDLESAVAGAAIARRRVKDRGLAEEVFAAALLRDVGKVLLAEAIPDYAGGANGRGASGAALVAAERAAIGVTHGEVSACLLALWGLPERIVDAVELHHEPDRAPAALRELVDAVHAADADS